MSIKIGLVIAVLLSLTALVGASAMGYHQITASLERADKLGYERGKAEVEKAQLAAQVVNIKELNDKVDQMYSQSVDAGNRLAEYSKTATQANKALAENAKKLVLVTQPGCTLTPDFRDTWNSIGKGK